MADNTEAKLKCMQGMDQLKAELWDLIKKESMDTSGRLNSRLPEIVYDGIRDSDLHSDLKILVTKLCLVGFTEISDKTTDNQGRVI